MYFEVKNVCTSANEINLVWFWWIHRTKVMKLKKNLTGDKVKSLHFYEIQLYDQIESERPMNEWMLFIE